MAVKKATTTLSYCLTRYFWKELKKKKTTTTTTTTRCCCSSSRFAEAIVATVTTATAILYFLNGGSLAKSAILSPFHPPITIFHMKFSRFAFMHLHWVSQHFPGAISLNKNLINKIKNFFLLFFFGNLHWALNRLNLVLIFQSQKKKKAVPVSLILGCWYCPCSLRNIFGTFVIVNPYPGANLSWPEVFFHGPQVLRNRFFGSIILNF